MKKLLEKLIVFQWTLKFLAFLGRRNFSKSVALFTNFFAWLNLKLNRPSPTRSIHELADIWVDLMPPDGRDLFKINSIQNDTAHVEIHLHCPLRGTGDVHACYQLMNYDRKLMKKVGGNLVVLESQSNSGNSFCSLAIRQEGLPTDDLVPAHELKLKSS